jgi:uncharacterized protein (UPF0332 family)
VQPPKKKHPNRPRPATIVPLSDEERKIKARQEFQKARIHLAEAESIAEWGKAPNACAHSIYFALDHCATAALLAAGGVGKRRDAPRSHEHIIEHYGKLVSSEAGYLGETAKVLNRARSERIEADYGLVRGVTIDVAIKLVEEARKFVDTCTTKWGLDKL